MKVTIDLSQLTPEQAFELGKLVNPVIAPISEPATKAPITKNRESGKSNKFQSKSKLDESFIERTVDLRRKGWTLQAIADWANSREIKTILGLRHTQQTVWSAIYSTNARKYWGI